MRISKVWSGLHCQLVDCTEEQAIHLTIKVYNAVVFVILGEGGFLRCFSSHSPVVGFWWRKMKWTLLVAPHLSGPNMIVKGVFQVS